MTRKHFRALADAIRTVADSTDNADVQYAIAQITSNVASVCKADNSNFDREKFYKAALGR